MILSGDKVYLRYPKEIDIETLFIWENDSDVLDVSDGQPAYSKKDIEKFVNSHHDIILQKQLRLMICQLNNDRALGCIDLFEYNSNHARAGVGILIYDKKDRNEGYGFEALQLLFRYCQNNLNLHQLYCNVQEHNKASRKLFQKANFSTIGLKKEWNKNKNGWSNEYMMQFIIQDGETP